MDKLTMCRICLVENLRMCVVVDKNMHELYEKLTNMPFVTEDSRPMLSCFICYAKLKQCCQLQRSCLAAEELLTQMIIEANPSIIRGQLEYFNRLIKTPIESISVLDVSQIDSITIKEELPAVRDRQDGVMEPKQENPQDEPEYADYGYSDEEDNILLQDSESDGDDVPLIEFKAEEEEEEQELLRKRRASDTRSATSTVRFVNFDTPRKERLRKRVLLLETKLGENKRKIKTLNQKVRRLHERNKSLKEILHNLKKQNYIDTDLFNSLMPGAY